MKKFLALALALIMVLALVACGGKDDPKDKPNNEPNGDQQGNSVQNEDKDFTALETDESTRICDMVVTGMKMDKEKYSVDEEIKITVTWEGTPADDTWIGIIPAEVPHGSEEENDQYDTDYRYFVDMKSGDTFVFEYGVMEPGEYTMRINESDAGGAELAWCKFTVKG